MRARLGFSIAAHLDVEYNIDEQILDNEDGQQLMLVADGLKATGQRVLIEGFTEMLFEVELAGHYGEIFSWLRDVRGDLGFVVIKQFSLERRDQALRDPLLTARLELASYRQGT